MAFSWQKFFRVLGPRKKEDSQHLETKQNLLNGIKAIIKSFGVVIFKGHPANWHGLYTSLGLYTTQLNEDTHIFIFSKHQTTVVTCSVHKTSLGNSSFFGAEYSQFHTVPFEVTTTD